MRFPRFVSVLSLLAVSVSASAATDPTTGINHIMVHITNVLPLPLMKIGGRPPRYSQGKKYPPYRATLHWRLDGVVHPDDLVYGQEVVPADQKYAVLVPLDSLRGRIYGGNVRDMITFGQYNIGKNSAATLLVPSDEYREVVRTVKSQHSFHGQIIPYEYDWKRGKYAGSAAKAYIKGNARLGLSLGEDTIELTILQFAEAIEYYYASEFNNEEKGRLLKTYCLDAYKAGLDFEEYVALFNNIFPNVEVRRGVGILSGLLAKDRDIVRLTISHKVEAFNKFRMIRYSNGKSYSEEELFAILNLNLMEPHKLHAGTPIGKLELDIVTANPFMAGIQVIEADDMCQRANVINRRIKMHDELLGAAFSSFLVQFYEWYDTEVFKKKGACEQE